MFDPDDLINYELCFPGAVMGSTEIECPHCGELLTVQVDDPMGQAAFQCGECSGVFDVDWAAGTVTPQIVLNLEIQIDVDDTE